MNSVPESHRKQGNDVIRLRKTRKQRFGGWLQNGTSGRSRGERRSAPRTAAAAPAARRPPGAGSSRAGRETRRHRNPAAPATAAVTRTQRRETEPLGREDKRRFGIRTSAGCGVTQSCCYCAAWKGSHAIVGKILTLITRKVFNISN